MTNLQSTIRSFFSGKAKLITIPILVIAALAFLPFTIGGLLAYAAYRYIPQGKVRNIAVAVIVIPTLFIGSTWVWVFYSAPSEPSPATTVSEQATATPLAAIEVEGTSTPTPTPEVAAEAPAVAAESTIATQTSPTPTTAAQPVVVEGVLVKRVIDGDTIELETGQTVRYIGIDTPETVHPSQPVGCFGKEASAKNTALVAGKRVRLEKDISETDRYGRLLRYVYVGDTFVNDSLVRQGYANASSYPPDVKYQDQFRQAEQEARAAKRGLWGSCSSGSSTSSATKPAATTAPATQPATSQCSIKGNISSSDEKIYHVPGCASYDKTVIDTSAGEKYFCSESEAKAAGWRKALNCP
ncbi:MAG: thermonuclease family protein [Candidatus Andersenbacteria bacterium]|nr:thermonuclease family protein [Candidatus Andersenbacteria bacterium]MBI3251107.1 thermonuclease family protein [Candidatus Andersenbacteria bacterium]